MPKKPILTRWRVERPAESVDQRDPCEKIMSPDPFRLRLTRAVSIASGPMLQVQPGFLDLITTARREVMAYKAGDCFTGDVSSISRSIKKVRAATTGANTGTM